MMTKNPTMMTNTMTTNTTTTRCAAHPKPLKHLERYTPEVYRRFTIEYNPKPIPTSAHDWDAFIDDQYPSLTAGSKTELLREIDEYWEDL